MRFDILLISVDSYRPEDLVSPKIPDKYLYDAEGHIYLTATVVDNEQMVSQLISFLFGGLAQPKEVFRNDNAHILDLSAARERLISFDYLEKNYTLWLETTGRDNTMNEYGMLIDFIGIAKMGLARRNLLMIVSKREADPNKSTL